MNLDVEPGPGVPGGKTSGPLSLSTSVQAEFRSDGTYTWHERLVGGGLTLWLSFPKEGEDPPRWEVVQFRGDRATVRLHFGEVDLQFHGRDSFSVIFPESAKVTGELNFRRVP